MAVVHRNILSKEFITVWGHLGRNFVTFLPNEKNVTISNWLNTLKIPKSFQSDFYTMQTNDFRLVSSQRERLARVRHTLDVMPSMSSQSSLSTSLSPELSATAIMRNFLPPNT